MLQTFDERNKDLIVNVGGDMWILGRAVFSVGDRNFGIGRFGPDGGNALTITEAGVVNIPGSLTLGGVAVQTTTFISCRINSTNPVSITNNRGRVTPGAFLQQDGQWKLTFTHPAGTDFVPHVTLCPPIGVTGMIAVWPQQVATELFVATSTVTGSAQTYSFYITIF